MSINLDPDAIRGGVEIHETLTGTQVDALLALPDEELETAIREVVDDDFWMAFDRARSDAIRWLLRQHGLGDDDAAVV